jgi:hypothetical protein
MKKLFIAVLATLSISLCNAQDMQMKGVMSLEFGSTREQVKQTLLAKQPGAKVYSSTERSMSFQDVTWGAYKTFLFMCQFSDDNRLHSVLIFVEPDHCSKVFTLYDEITKIINERYYVTTKSLESYSYPYERKDKYRYTETMVKNGKVTMQSLWTFDSRSTPTDTEDDNCIKAEVADECLVIITYQDGLIIDEVIAKQKAKQSKDY